MTSHENELPELLQLERAGWAAVRRGDATSFYRGLLTNSATVFLEEEILDREGALRHWAGLAPWSTWEVFDPRTMRLSPTVGAVSYHVIARVAEDSAPYTASCTSVYVRQYGGWRLAFHEQKRVT